MIDAGTVRKDFPIFSHRINGRPIVYLDSGATSQKPKQVISAMEDYYRHYTANVFRGIYTMSEQATTAYEESRKKIAAFIGAKHPEEIIFTRNTSEALNLIAYSYLPGHIGKDDALAVSIMEHHSNFVPWQQYGIKTGAALRIWYTGPSGQLRLEDLDKLITRRTKLLAFTAASNVLGTLTPVERIVRAVRKLNPSCLVVVDAAQAVPHMPVNVRAWGADAVAFSGHKMFGPSGIGVLWMKKEHLERMPPFLYGGDMIREVHERETVFNDLPHKFESGTPFIEGAIGLGAAVDYLSGLGMEAVREHEQRLTSYAMRELARIPGLTVYGPPDPAKRGGVVAFRMEGIHPHDIAQLLDRDNVCVRVGFHCAMPLHEYLHIGPTVRATFSAYNDTSDIDMLVAGLEKVKNVFA